MFGLKPIIHNTMSLESRKVSGHASYFKIGSQKNKTTDQCNFSVINKWKWNINMGYTTNEGR